MDEVRVSWTLTNQGFHSVYGCWLTHDNGKRAVSDCLFSSTNRAEFFARYNALVIEKEAPHDA